jgi:hypothetical protein
VFGFELAMAAVHTELTFSKRFIRAIADRRELPPGSAFTVHNLPELRITTVLYNYDKLKEEERL